MILFDGTAWLDALPLSSALAKRPYLTSGYMDEALEVKRLKAIDWLREKSAKGWICDCVIRRERECE